MGRNGYIIRVEDEEARRDERREQARKRLENQFRGYRHDGGSYRNEHEFSEKDYEEGFCDGYEHAMKQAGMASMRDGMGSMRDGMGSMRDGMGSNTTHEMYRNSKYGN